MRATFRKSVAALLLGTAIANAQDPRLERPENLKTPVEVWKAVKFELDTGMHDQAAYYVKLLLDRKPTDAELVDLENKVGMASFLRLRNVPMWSADPKVQAESKKNAEELIARISAAQEKVLGDSARIAKFSTNLRASPEERDYAIRELQRSGARAIPHLMSIIVADPDPTSRASIYSALSLLPEETVPGVIASLDTSDGKIKYELLKSLAARPDFTSLPGRTELNPLPTLEHLAASTTESPEVQELARTLITKLRPTAKTALRPANRELTDAAWKYYRHQERFTNTAAVPMYRWEDNKLVPGKGTPSQAEEYYGLRAARWALELAPDDVEAQTVFLSIALDKAFERAGMDANLTTAAPEVHNMLASASIGTLLAALDQAIVEKRTPVVLGITQILAERAEIKAAQPSRYRAGALQRALEYPDTRVQLAAAEGLIRLPAGSHAVQARIVEALSRALSSEAGSAAPGKPRVLVGHFDRVKLLELTKLFEGAGYVVSHARTGREVLQRLQKSLDVDIVAIDADLPYPTLPDLLAELRFDVSASAVPVRVLYTPVMKAEMQSSLNEATLRRTTTQTQFLRDDEERASAASEDRVTRLTSGLRQVSVVKGPLTPELLRASFSKEAAPEVGTALTPAERKAFAAKAIELFRQIAVSRAAGYDLKPAERAIRQALSVPELAASAVEILGRIPGRDPQGDLARLVLDEAAPAPLRTLAAENLVKHIQQYGSGLLPEIQKRLEDQATTAKDAAFRGRVAGIVGALKEGPAATGERLRTYFPPKPAVPATATPPATEPEKDKN